MTEDTIIAISTPFGFGGLGIVRLSGKKSLSIARKLFKPKRAREIKPRQPTLGSLYDFEQDEAFDEAYLTFFPRPSSYTREDIVEISCHGSPVVLEEIVRLGIKAGARQADPGEFTLRAFLGGRVDLIQAEAVNDLIHATSLVQAKSSFSQIQGKLSARTASLRDSLIHLLAQIEACIEFPDEGLKISQKRIRKTLENIILDLQKLVKSYDLGKALSQGTSLAIIGRANVGKSTLFNSLLGAERAIVTPYPGTTRDYLRETIQIEDALFTLLDMAGLEVTHHPVEKKGIQKAQKQAAEADGVLLLFDCSWKESNDDINLLEKFRERKAILLFNKMDLPQKMDKEKVKSRSKGLPSLEISALKGTNLAELRKTIHRVFLPRPEQDGDIIFHLRQKLFLEDILGCLLQAKHLHEEGHPEEFYGEEIRKALPFLSQLIGEIRSDEVIEDIFRRFCVGK